MLSGPECVALLLLGGWVALDSALIGQFMVSRPLVATILAGAIVGRPAEAAQVALLLEALHLRVLPIGAARFPEGGPAGVVAGAAAAAFPSWPMFLTVVVFALFWEWVGGETTRLLRLWNGRARLGGKIAPSALERLHRRALARDFTRGVVLVAAGIPLLWALLNATEPLVAGSGNVARIALVMSAIAAVAASARLFGLGRLPFAALGAVIVSAALWIE